MKRVFMGTMAVVMCFWAFSAMALPEGAMARLGKGRIGEGDRAVAFSPDGSMVAVTSSIGVYLYDLSTFSELYFFKTNNFMISVAFSLDSNLLAGGGLDNTIKLWDIVGKEEVATLKGHTDDVLSVAFSLDGNLLVSGSSDNTIKVWDIAGKEEVTTLRGHTGNVVSFSFTSTPYGDWLASGSTDKTIRLWDVVRKRAVATLRGHTDSVCSVSFCLDGSLLASGGDEIRIWDMVSMKSVATLMRHSDEVRSISFSPDGKLLASGSKDKTIKLWDVESKKEVTTLGEYMDSVLSIAFSPDGNLLAGGSADGTIKFWDMEDKKEVTTLSGFVDGGYSVAFSPDDNLLASGGWDKAIRLWNIERKEEVAILRGHKDRVNSVAFSPNGRLLASGSDWRDTTIKLWDIARKEETATLRGHINWINSVAFDPDGRLLASGSADNTIKIWNLKSRNVVATLWGHKAGVNSVDFSSNGTLASGSYDNTIKLWNVAFSLEIATLGRHTSSINSIAFNPDGKLLASGSHDTTIKLWDVARRKEIATLKGHTDNVYSVAFSPDGRLLASGSSDDTIRLWDVARKEEIATLKGHTKSVYSVAFSPQDQLLASGSWDGTVLIWDVSRYLPAPINQPPTVDGIQDQTIKEGKEFASVRLDDYVSDPDNGDSEITWSYSGNERLKVNIDDDRVASITIPDPEWNGSETITFTATDPGGLSDSDDATFTVTYVNDPPVLSKIPSQTIREDELFADIRLDDYVYDPDNEDWEMKWTCPGSENLVVNIDDNRIASITIAKPGWNGSEIIAFTVTEPGGLTASDDVPFTVIPVDDPPVVSDIPDQTIEEGEEFAGIRLDEYVSDVDSPIEEIIWTYTGNEKLNVTIDDDRVATFSVSEYRWSGSETITFTATDPGGLSDSDSATFTMTPLEFEPGDVNGDGVVRSSDAIMALRISVGLMEATYYQKVAADMNGDGIVKSNDAIMILRKSAGLAAPGADIAMRSPLAPLSKGGNYGIIAMAEAHGMAGECVTVPVIIDDIGVLAGGDVCIAYDNSVIQAVDVSSPSDVLLVSNFAESGLVRFAFACENTLANETLVEIEFNVIADGLSLLEFESVELYDNYVRPMNLRSVDGQFMSWAMRPDHSALLRNYPNPFNPDTWIPYQLREDSYVSISIYDVAGRLVRRLEPGNKPAGMYVTKDRAAYWDGRNDAGEMVSSGVYMMVFVAGDCEDSQRVVLIR